MGRAELFAGVLLSALAATICNADSVALKALEFPPKNSIHEIDGELVCADFIHRSGQFRESKTGELHDFVMLPYGAIIYQNTEADLRDVPLGTSMRFLLTKDADGKFTRLAQMQGNQKNDKTVTDQQRKKFTEFIKKRGLPGGVEKTEGNTLTVTLFSGDPQNFKASFMSDFAVGKDISVVVANDELRTWNPPTDKEKASLLKIEDVSTENYGCSGVRLTISVTNMLEGFRLGRCVRIFGPGWTIKDPPYGESLMGYGYARLQTAELMECTPKEYPIQFPFRTDYGNVHLPWFQLKPGSAPPAFAEHLVFGELVKADASSGTGQFRTDRTGELVNFTLIPEGAVRHLHAESSLADLPMGTRCRFSLFQDEKGAFTKASLVSDEYSYLASNAITLRIEGLKLDQHKILVARQIPETKNYNGDMERIPDIGRQELLVASDTRVWKSSEQIKLSDLKVGDALLINVTSEQTGKPSHCTDLWVNPDIKQLGPDKQQKKSAPKKK